ncbi:hypothetical protein ACOQFO_06800 [Ureibacillus sp. MALMAid1270]|uniref:hypothetical protein n=1 Tax=Ureibacillus sp. MALMAid1270 TaxID=3411629 RepID=UPI003BA540E3
MKYYIGYHGTSTTNAQRIKQTNFVIDYTKVGWLGTGTYLFDENQELARSWANYKYPTVSKNIVRCEIEVDKEKVFDVVDPLGEHNKFFHAIRKQLIEQQLKNRNIEVKVKNKKDFDGKTYNFICKAKDFKLVRAATYTYQEYDRTLRLDSRVPNGVELCVKDLRIIKNKQIIS